MIRSRDIDNRRFIFSPAQSILMLLHYFVGYTFLYPKIMVWIDDVFFKTEGGIHPKLFTTFMIFMILSSLAIVWDSLKRSWRLFKANLKVNLKSVGQNMVYLLAANFIINLMLILVFKIETQSENQVIVVEMIKQAFVPMFLSTVIFAPLVEEVIFRGVLYQNLRSRRFYILPMILSIVLFASMHLLAGLSAGKGWSEFIFIFQYAGLSFFMIRAMEQTNNLFGAICIHFINNTIAFTTIFVFAHILI